MSYFHKVGNLCAGYHLTLLYLHQEMSVAVEDVIKMREGCMSVERSEKGVEQLLRYYLQLSAMDCKLPINENQVGSDVGRYQDINRV